MIQLIIQGYVPWNCQICPGLYDLSFFGLISSYFSIWAVAGGTIPLYKSQWMPYAPNARC